MEGWVGESWAGYDLCTWCFLEGRGIEQRMNFGGQPTLCLGHFFIRNKNTIVIIIIIIIIIISIIIIIIIIINIPTVWQIYFRKMNETVKVHPESFYLAFKRTRNCFLIIFLTACKVVVNQSIGGINVTHSNYTSLYCFWSIGNVGIPQAIGLVLIQEMNFGYCRYLLILLLC